MVQDLRMHWHLHESLFPALQFDFIVLKKNFNFFMSVGRVYKIEY